MGVVTSSELSPTWFIERLHNSLDFTGKVVLITGGTRGLGKVLCRTFLDAGAEVFTCARQIPDKPITSSNGSRQASFITADVRNTEQVEKVVTAAVEKTGYLNVLINNAGGAPTTRPDASMSFHEKIIALNLTAALSFSQAARNALADGDGGVILNISSISGTRPNPGGVAYGAAKAGLTNLSQTLAHEWGPNIRVLTINVGMMITEEATALYGDTEKRQAIGDLLASKRMGEPEDVADMCLVLASPQARWMNGTEIAIHGGDEHPSYLEVLRSTSKEES